MGGRIDVVGTAPVATLVYQRREHQIALTRNARDADGAVGCRALRRATAMRCSNGGTAAVAMSPCPICRQPKLSAFAAAFRRAAAAEYEEAPKP